MLKQTHKTKKKSRLRLLHQYYVYTGFYKFLKDAILKAIPIIIIVIGILLTLNYFVIDVSTLLTYATEHYSNTFIVFLFFISESLLGLIPPELFIAWSDKTVHPVGLLSLIALASYAGGVVSYFIGQAIGRLSSVHEYLQHKMAKHVKHVRKWGGLMIAVSALFPVPFSPVSIATGMIKYPFSYYLIFALFRFVRFYIYALFIFRIVE